MLIVHKMKAYDLPLKNHQTLPRWDTHITIRPILNTLIHKCAQIATQIDEWRLNGTKTDLAKWKKCCILDYETEIFQPGDTR